MTPVFLQIVYFSSYNEFSNKIIIVHINNLFSRRMRWAGHVARMGRRRIHIGYRWKARRKEITRKTKM
jgi:hypothetical protein